MRSPDIPRKSISFSLPLVATLAALTMFVAITFVVVIWRNAVSDWQKVEVRSQERADQAAVRLEQLISGTFRTARMSLHMVSLEYPKFGDLRQHHPAHRSHHHLFEMLNQLPKASRLYIVRALPNDKLLRTAVWRKGEASRAWPATDPALFRLLRNHHAHFEKTSTRVSWVGPVLRRIDGASFLTISIPIRSAQDGARRVAVLLIGTRFLNRHASTIAIGNGGWIGVRDLQSSRTIWLGRKPVATQSVTAVSSKVAQEPADGRKDTVGGVKIPVAEKYYLSGRDVGRSSLVAMAAYSKETARALWRRHRISDVAQTAVFVLILVLLALPAYLLIVRPLGQAAFALRSLKRGDFDHPVPQTGGVREIRDVLAGLEDVRKALGRLTNDLNDEVKQRTAELEASNAELTRARDDAEEANKAKTDFLANMSHELRTPLNAIIGFSEIMRLEQFGPIGHARYLEYSNDIHKSGTHLLNLIGDVLNIAKIESGHLELNTQTINIPVLVRDSIKSVSAAAVASGVQVILDIDPGVPNLQGDERAMTQVMLNLLSNAVKFTPRGGRITVSALRNSNGAVCLQVADTGIGMEEKDIPRALTRFERIEGAYSRQYDGTGIGLPLSKSLVELHGGTVLVHSEKGSGTTVIVELPASRSIDRSDWQLDEQDTGVVAAAE